MAASGGWLDGDTLRVELIFLETPHRMDITARSRADSAGGLASPAAGRRHRGHSTVREATIAWQQNLSVSHERLGDLARASAF